MRGIYAKDIANNILMAKSKNHTSHHHERRYHKNGIHKVPRRRYISLKGCTLQFLRNRRRAIRFDPVQNKHFVAKKVVAEAPKKVEPPTKKQGAKKEGKKVAGKESKKAKK
eukprot:TRINITY_DN607_c0_g1_i1.p2 TRINITY_DN607_c0_g1~~TRINITY_DN607_c0_g1_i1.p2  ORF type:complete len:111 (+),score=38.91 TRINITY_DN607_c0_g1_i1:32-364(+)